MDYDRLFYDDDYIYEWLCRIFSVGGGSNGKKVY